MGRSPCCSKEGLNKGAWTALEDKTLTEYINIHGEGKWRHLPKRAGDDDDECMHVYMEPLTQFHMHHWLIQLE